jgi:hypothetical protein
MEEITLKVIENDHDKVVLENKKGDRFIFNPMTQNGESLYDFLLM